MTEIKCIKCGAVRVAKRKADIGSGKFCSTQCAYKSRVKESREAKFWRYVNKQDNCWLWLGSRYSNGYGRLLYDKAQILAHRVAWELTNGLIPNGLFVCHHCDNKLCVRLDHLFLGTPKDNTADMVNKGRHYKHPKGQLAGENNPNSKLTNVDVIAIRNTTSPRRIIAEKFSISLSTVNNVLNHKTFVEL